MARSIPEPLLREEEETLLERLRAGSEHAFDILFRRYYPDLVRAAQALLGDRDAAEEVAQDVLLELWRRRAATRIDTTLRAYLYRAVRNRALNVIRHDTTVRRAQPLLVRFHGGPAPSDADLIEGEIRGALDRALDALPPRCREVFELNRVHGLRYAEVAEAMGISIKTVEVQMGKALRIVRTHLAPWLPEADLPE